MKQKFFINLHKGVTFLYILILMSIYGQWNNVTAWVYFSLHGSYGILWVLKSMIFPDKNWEKPTNIVLGLFIWVALSLYWVSPWIIVSNNLETPPWYLSLCILLYCFGIFFHFVSDMQKYVILKLQPCLITTGLWARCRNPNYFGELLIYLSFSLLTQSWIPFIIFGLIVVMVWIPNMCRKDHSLSRYSEFPEYYARSAFLIPFLI